MSRPCARACAGPSLASGSESSVSAKGLMHEAVTPRSSRRATVSGSSKSTLGGGAEDALFTTTCLSAMGLSPPAGEGGDAPTGTKQAFARTSGRRSGGRTDGTHHTATSSMAAIPEANSVNLSQMTKEERQLAMMQQSTRKQPGTTVDVVFMIDCTASMNPYASAVASTVGEVIDTISSECSGARCRVGILAYRDHCDADQQFDSTPLTEDVDAVRTKVAGLAASGCFGGGDAPEDVHGALNEVMLDEIGWAADTCLLVHVADAPCHGRRFHADDIHDHHPDGYQGWEDPAAMTAEALLQDLVAMDINYAFLRLTPHTEKMLGLFRDIYRGAAKGTSNHFTVADIGAAPDQGNPAAWQTFLDRFAGMLRGTLRDSISRSRPTRTGVTHRSSSRVSSKS